MLWLCSRHSWKDILMCPGYVVGIPGRTSRCTGGNGSGGEVQSYLPATCQVITTRHKLLLSEPAQTHGMTDYSHIRGSGLSLHTQEIC